MASAPRVYVASPLGFAASTRGYLIEVLAALRERGFECLDPWHDPEGDIAGAFADAEAIESSAERMAALAAIDSRVGRRNVEMIEAADAVLAVLDGQEVDSGTASEIGFAAARGTPVVGVRSDLRRAGENDGCVVNLQVEYFIRMSGGSITTEVDTAIDVLAPLAQARRR
jgi:nucleoside 2-deoxyribosyltransferase